MKFNYFFPLITFLIPTIIITTVLFIYIPPEPIMLVGFIILLIAASSTYLMGIKAVIKDWKESK